MARSETLSLKTQGIIKRFEIHRDRCEWLEFCLGEGVANAFHKKFKTDPASEDAEREYERLMSAVMQ